MSSALKTKPLSQEFPGRVFPSQHPLLVVSGPSCTYTPQPRSRAVFSSPPQLMRILPAVLSLGNAGVSLEFIFGAWKESTHQESRHSSDLSRMAISLLSAVLLSLSHLRDSQGLVVTPELVKQSLDLQAIKTLASRTDLLKSHTQALQAYLRSIPIHAYPPTPHQPDLVHAFLQSQLSDLLDGHDETIGFESQQQWVLEEGVIHTTSLVSGLVRWLQHHPGGQVALSGLPTDAPLFVWVRSHVDYLKHKHGCTNVVFQS